MTKLNTFSKISCPVLSLFYIFSRICELCPFPNMPSVCQHQSAVIDSENPSSDHGVLQCDIIYRRPTDHFLFLLFCHAFSYSMSPPPFRQGGTSHLDVRKDHWRLFTCCSVVLQVENWTDLPPFIYILYIHKMISILILSGGYILSCDWAVCLSSIVITTWNPCQNA